MLLKISLGLAILVGIATLYLTHFQIAPKLDELKGTLASTQTQLNDSREAESKAKKNATDLKASLDKLSKDYNESTNALLIAATTAEEQRKRADKNAADLEERTRERNEARDELSQWHTLGYTIDVLRQRIALVAGLEKENAVIKDENKLLDRNLKLTQAELDRWTGVIEKPVPVPPGTRGKVVAVDPKYDFVVLNIGEKEGILPNAQLLVNRDGKLIGKVKVSTVQAGRSIANVMPEWKQGDIDIQEGDQVIGVF
jgi:hypothetical protein